MKRFKKFILLSLFFPSIIKAMQSSELPQSIEIKNECVTVTFQFLSEIDFKNMILKRDSLSNKLNNFYKKGTACLVEFKQNTGSIQNDFSEIKINYASCKKICGKFNHDMFLKTYLSNKNEFACSKKQITSYIITSVLGAGIVATDIIYYQIHQSIPDALLITTICYLIIMPITLWITTFCCNPKSKIIFNSDFTSNKILKYLTTDHENHTEHSSLLEIDEIQNKNKFVFCIDNKRLKEACDLFSTIKIESSLVDSMLNCSLCNPNEVNLPLS